MYCQYIVRAHNRLELNNSTTEVLHVKSRFARTLPVQISTSVILSYLLLREFAILESYINSCLSMSGHINSVCKSASFAIRKIFKIRRYLDQASGVKLVHAFMSSLLDNCNSILFGLPDKRLNQLQRIQKKAARITTFTMKRDYITLVMCKLPWLPIHARIVIKLTKL